MKVKFLVLLSAISIVTSVPLQPKQESSKEVYKSFMLQQLKWKSMISRRDQHPRELEFKDESVNEIEELNTRIFRLPNNTMPLHYELYFTTNVHAADFSFHAMTSIRIKVLEPSNTITLHASQLLIERINLLTPQGDMVQFNMNFRLDSVTQLLEIIVDRELQVGQEFELYIEAFGVLRTNRLGFYRTSYTNRVTGQINWVASTLFEPTHARSAFPCYDEIRFRTAFDITITHHRSYNALSNMPVELINNSGDFVVTRFQTTPTMPTFNLAFTVSNYDFISNNNTELPMKVFAQPAQIAAGRADAALELSEKMWTELRNIFEIPYPLPKCDIVAVNNWRNGEAWGLLKIDEWGTLGGRDHLVSNRFRRIQIAHELSHTYFSNLVSPSSWSYLWLNEGFATLYENILNDNVFPETTNWEDFLIDFYDFVVEFDSFGFLNPLNRYVESPSEIASKFSLETYRKGALILRMLKDAITEEVFIQGVKYYLDEMQFKSASPEDLFAGIQKAYDEVFPETDLNINELMQTWTNVRGIPIVTVSRSANGLLLTQEALGSFSDDLFSIPINFATASNKNFDDVSAELWMTTKEHEITRENAGKTWTDDDWVIFNLRDTGYYMTNYDETLWGLITSTLANDHEDIHFLNRGTLFADTFRFIQHAVDFRATIFMELIDSLKLEFHPHVWRRAHEGMRTFESRLRGSEIHPMYLAFINDLMTGIYGRSFENSRFETNIVNSHSCRSGVLACNDDALGALIEVMETGRTTFRGSFRCNAFRVANESIWMHFFDETMSRNGETWERMSSFFDLECTQNPKLIQHVLETTIDMTNNLLPFERDNMMRFMSRESFEGYEAVIEFIEQNHEIINENFPHFALVNTISMLASNTNTECQAEKVLDLVRFVSESHHEWFDRALVRTSMEQNLRFISRNFEDIHEWLKNYENGK